LTVSAGRVRHVDLTRVEPTELKQRSAVSPGDTATPVRHHSWLSPSVGVRPNPDLECPRLDRT
jgi:hypothetical protein